MKPETVIYTLLNASSAIAAQVGAKIYLDTRPEADPLPAITFGLISDVQDGARPIDPELVTARVQVNCMGNVADDLVNLRENVRLACHNRSGTIGGIEVVACIQQSMGPDTYDELVNVYLKPIDFKIHYVRYPT